MKRRNAQNSLLLLTVMLAIALPLAFSLAQDNPTDGEFSIKDEQVDSGSGEMTDGEFTLYGTAGVPFAGDNMTDGEYTIEPVVQTPKAPANAYIRLSATAFEFSANWQGVNKQPVSDMYVEVYDDSCADVSGYGSWNWKADLRADYFNAVRANCYPPIASAITGPDGTAEIGVYKVPGAHVVIGFYQKEILGELYQLYLAKRVQIDEAGSATDVKLGVMIYPSRFVAKTRVLPLMGTTVYGSELNIYEPEYIIWEPGQTQEDFPFIEQSAETWQIDTSLYPPEGYVPDETTKTTFVEGTTEITVFQVTEVGSVMDHTKVDYDIKELKDGKVVKRHKFTHMIGTKSNAKPEKFAKPIPTKVKAAAAASTQQPEAVKLHEVVVGEQNAEQSNSSK